MATPQTLREFKEDFEAVRSNRTTALLNLKFATQKEQADQGYRRTLLAATECGQALKRMHESQSFRDSYDSWAALCRALKLGREYSYRLMSYAEPAAVLPDGEIVTNAPDDSKPILSLLSDEEPAEEKAPTPPEFDALRDRLRSAPPQELKDPEAEKRRQGESGLAFVRRITADLGRYFDRVGLSAKYANILAGMIQDAEMAEKQADAKAG